MFSSSLLRKSLPILFLLLGAAEVNASITYTSGLFRDFDVDTDMPNLFIATADIFQGNVLAGTATVTMTYGGGNNPFQSPLSDWGAGADFRATADAPNDPDSTAETAVASYSFSVTANAGFQVDGISLFSVGTTLANPTFQNLSSNGIGSVADDNQGAANELLANYNDGDAFINGDDLIFRPGTSGPGILNGSHSRLWSFDSAGATLVTFDYLAGPVTNIANEGIRFDVQLSTAPVPEPGSAVLLGIVSLLALRRRKHI